MKNFMYKFKEWFKDNIFEAFYGTEDNGMPIGDCFGLMLFRVYFNFSYFYSCSGNVIWYLEEDIKRITNEIEKKNKKRKNKLPIPEFKRIPIYKTMVDWGVSYYGTRNFCWFILGSVFGIALMGLI